MRRKWTDEEIAADADFPHGHPRGGWRGCHCADCLAALARYKRRSQYLRDVGRPVLRPPTTAQDRVRSWLDSGGTPYAVARATGLSYSGIQRLIAGKRLGLRASTVEAIERTTLDDVLAHLPEHSFVPSATSIRLVQCLQAQGYTGRWIVQQVGGKTAQSNLAFVVQRRALVMVKTARAVAALAERVGDAEGPSERTRVWARKQGYWPLAAYEDNGTLNLRRLPGHPWAEADDMAGRHLDALAWWAEHPAATPLEVVQSQDVLCDGNEVKRIAERIKRLHGDRWHAALREAVEAYDHGADGVLAALRAGVVIVGGRASAQVPVDHPAAIEFLSEPGVSQAS